MSIKKPHLNIRIILYRFCLILLAFTVVATQQVAATTQNSLDCAQAGGFDGDCGYDAGDNCQSAPAVVGGGSASIGNSLTMKEVDTSDFHPDPQAEKYFKNTALPLIKKFIPRYVKAAEAEGVPQNWEILAALHGPELGYQNFFKSNGVSNNPAGGAGGPSGPYQETAYEMKAYLSDPEYKNDLKTLVNPNGTAKTVSNLSDEQFIVLSRLAFKHWVRGALGDDYKKLEDGPIPFNKNPDFLIRVMGRWNSGDVTEGFNGFDSGAHAYNPSKSVWPGMATTYYLLKQWEANGGMKTISTSPSKGSACVDPNGDSASGSPDCTSANGNEKILCIAKKYDGIYYRYGGAHGSYDTFKTACPDPSKPGTNKPTGAPPLAGGNSGNPSPCATDCSSLVSVAVDEAFNQKFMWTVGTLQADTARWKKISMNDIKAGDVITVSSEHIEIVDHYDKSAGKIYEFGSHSTGTKTSAGTSNPSSWTGGAFRYIGPGSS